MTGKDKNVDFCNLVQTQNLLDLELHELRAILYPKLLHLMEIEKFDDQVNQVSTQRKQSSDDIYIDENVIIENRLAITSSLLDDRCIVGYILQRRCVLGENDLKKVRNRFYKRIRYSGKDYSKKLFNALLEHSLSTGKTIIIDKNIRLERIGQNTQWKIDFTNFLVHNCRASYGWLNHIRLGKLRELGLLTLRNHLNQQMIRQRRTEINSRLQQEVQNHLDKDQQKKKVNSKRTNRLNNNVQEKYKQNQSSKKINDLDEFDYSIVYPEEVQLNMAEQKVQNVLNELSCLENFRYVNQFLDFRGDVTQVQHQGLYRGDKERTIGKTAQWSNEFEANLAKRSKMLNIDEVRDILEEERMRNLDHDDSDEDEMAVTMPNYKQKNKSKNRRWPRVKRLKRRFVLNYKFVQMRCSQFLRKKTFNLFVRYEEIQNQPIIIGQLTEFGQELSSPLPANVPYCGIGKSSLIAALKQFNWSHTQGPFIYNQCL